MRPVRIGDHDRLRGLVDRRGQARPVRLGFVDGRDILGDDHGPAHAAVFVAQRGDEELEVARLAIPVRIADRDGDERLAGHHLGKPARDPGRIVGAKDGGRVAHDLVLAPAEHELGGRAPGGDPAIPIDGHDGQGAGSEDRGRRLDGRAPLALRAGEEMIASRQHAPERDGRDHDEPDTLDGARDLAGAAGQDGSDEDVRGQDPRDPDDGVPAGNQGGRHQPSPAGSARCCPVRRFAVCHATPAGAVSPRTGAYGAARPGGRAPFLPPGPDLRATHGRAKSRGAPLPGPLASLGRADGAHRAPGATCRGRRRRTWPPAPPRAAPPGCGRASRRRS